MRKADIVVVSILLVVGSITGAWRFLQEVTPGAHNSFDNIVFSTAYSRITNQDNELIIEESADQASSVRNAIYAVVDANPGIHFREICRALGRENGVVQYHSRVLQHFRKVTTFKDGRYVRYFVNDTRMFDDAGKAIVSAWHRPVEREVLLAPLGEKKKKYPVKELIDRCGISRQSLNWHLTRMADLDLITVEFMDDERHVVIEEGVLELLAELMNAGALQ